MRGLLARIGPGLLVAATGVGAGDLATAGFTGAELGVTVAWAVLLGACLKFVLTEGVARWQIATGTTLLHGIATRLGHAGRIAFLAYLVPWTYFTGAALISASGVAATGLVPITDDPQLSKIIWGVTHSMVGALLVLAGGFKLFERVMTVAIGVMVVAVLVAAVGLRPDLVALARGLAVPVVPAQDGAVRWTIALIGGVGGTLTILCYGYWLRDQHPDRPPPMPAIRLDLAVGYAVTALFGVGMLVIASRAGGVEGKGATLIVNLADRIGHTLGAWARLVFLVGAWAAIFSSLLGVWQAVPYLFADFVRACRTSNAGVLAGDETKLERTHAYRLYLAVIATVPLFGLFVSFKAVQQSYAVFGATIVPLLAVVLLALNTRRRWVGAHRNRRWTNVTLALVILFSAYYVAQIARGG